MHASPFVTPSEAAVLPACSLYNHSRRSPGSRSITRECCRSALAWKGVGSPGVSSGAPFRGRCQYRTEAPRDEGGSARLAGGLVSRGLRPRSSQDESLDGHARATRWKRRLRGPFSLLSLLFLIAIFVPEQHAVSSPPLPIYLPREPGFFSSVVSSVPLLHTSYSALLLISLYLLMNPMVESRYLLRLVLYNREGINEFIRWSMRHDNIAIFWGLHAWQIVIKSESGVQALCEGRSAGLLIMTCITRYYVMLHGIILPSIKISSEKYVNLDWTWFDLGLMVCKFYSYSLSYNNTTNITKCRIRNLKKFWLSKFCKYHAYWRIFRYL